MTDEEIQRLLQEVKRPVGRPRRSVGFGERFDVNLTGADTETAYVLYGRQNSEVPEDFRVGLRIRRADSADRLLRTYNGEAHSHNNPLEGERLPKGFHIHTATQRYQARRNRLDGYAEVTDRYNDLRGALSAMLVDCHIAGLTVEELLPPTQGSLLELMDED